MTKTKKKIELIPDTTLLEKIGQGHFTVAEAISELVANSFDARIWIKSKNDEESVLPLVVEIEVSGDFVRIVDNGKGMSDEVLQEALKLGRDMNEVTGNSRNRMGLFGLGMKSASSSIGKVWTVATKTDDSNFVHSVTFDLKKFAKGKKWEIDIEAENASESKYLKGFKHGTMIEIKGLHDGPPSVGPILHLLGTAYKPLIGNGNVIKVNGDEVLERPYNLVEDSKIDIHIVVDEEKGWEITGWGGLDTKTNNNGAYGFQLYRENQLIEQWNKSFFRAHLMTSRVVGELHLNFVPTKYTKQGFQEESKEWKAAKAELTEMIKPLAKASGDMAKGKSDPMRGARAIAGLRKAAGVAPSISLENENGSTAVSEVKNESTKSTDPSTLIEANSIQIGSIKISLAYAFEDFGDEPVLWDYIYDSDVNELQAVINSGSALFSSITDAKFLGTLALADVVMKFLINQHNFPMVEALEIRDAWILAAVAK